MLILCGLLLTTVVHADNAWSSTDSPDRPGAEYRRRLAQLADDDFRTREAATAALIHMGPAIVPAIQLHLRDEMDPEVKLRCEKIARMARLATDQLAEVQKVLADTLAFLRKEGPKFQPKRTKVETEYLGKIVERIIELAPAKERHSVAAKAWMEAGETCKALFEVVLNNTDREFDAFLSQANPWRLYSRECKYAADEHIEKLNEAQVDAAEALQNRSDQIGPRHGMGSSGGGSTASGGGGTTNSCAVFPNM